MFRLDSLGGGGVIASTRSMSGGWTWIEKTFKRISLETMKLGIHVRNVERIGEILVLYQG